MKQKNEDSQEICPKWLNASISWCDEDDDDDDGDEDVEIPTS